MPRHVGSGVLLTLGLAFTSVGKESACNAGDPDLIPGLGKSAGEGIGYPCQYSWASLVAQLVKNPPAMQETRVRSLGWEGPLEKRKATLSSPVFWPGGDHIVHGVAKSWTRLSDFHSLTHSLTDYLSLTVRSASTCIIQFGFI